jgi:hypothetical protein
MRISTAARPQTNRANGRRALRRNPKLGKAASIAGVADAVAGADGAGMASMEMAVDSSMETSGIRVRRRQSRNQRLPEPRMRARPAIS